MAKQLFANNVSTQIMEFLSASDTTITVSSTSRFPTIAASSGDWIMATLVPQGGFGTPEIVKITSFTGNTVTVTRGQEGTTAQDFQFGSLLELRVTKGTLEWLRDQPTIFVDAITAVNASGMVDGTVLYAKGRTTVNDGGGGIFHYIAGSSQTADEGTVVTPATGTGRFFRTGFSGSAFSGPVNAQWFGATSSLLSALTSAGTTLNTGGAIHLPKATYTLASKYEFAGQRLHIHGDGANVSKISFDPAGTDIALSYKNVSAGGLFQGSIKNIGFTSANSNTKTAIEFYNVADSQIEGIGIPSGSWAGSGSIGIRSYGRQFLKISDCRIACARPVVFSQNPVFTSLNTDHYLVEYSEFTTTLSTGSCIEFENGVMHTNTTLRNLALTGGKNGILWNDTTSVGASYAMSIENIRVEQAADATGWSVDLQTTGQSLQNLTIKNFYTDIGRNGIRLRKVLLATLENVRFPQTTGTQLDVTLEPGSRLVLINCYFETGGTKTITNGRRVRTSASALGHTVEEWVYDADKTSGAQYSDVYTHGNAVSLANGDTTIIGASSNSTGIIFITTSEDVSAIYVLKGPTNSTAEISDPDGFFTPTKNSASAYNIYHEAGNYFLQNNRGVSATVSIFKMLTTV